MDICKFSNQFVVDNHIFSHGYFYYKNQLHTNTMHP